MTAGSASAGGFEWRPGDRTAVRLHAADATALAETAARLGPPGVRFRWDRRVDAGVPVEGSYGDWRSLLFDLGLAWRRHGDELHVRPAGLPAGATELAVARAGASDWRVWKGETLRAALARWGARAGVEIVWRTDRRYRLQEGRVFLGRTFREAAAALFVALGGLPEAPAGALSEDGRILAVRHAGRSGRAE